MKYSPSHNGFYTPDIHGDRIPTDAVEITPERYAALAGREVVPDESGYPVLLQSTPSKADKWEAIKSERDRRIHTGGYQVGGKWFHSDLLSRTQQIGLVLMAGAIPPGLQWKTMDGSFVTMTQQLAGQVFAAAAASDQALSAAGEAHRAAMEASPDPGSYDISSGWPPVFGD